MVFFDGAEDVLVARAAAQVAGEELPELVVSVFLAGIHDLGGGQDEAGRAEAALDGSFVHERLLDIGDRAVGVHETLERDDVLALSPDGEVQAGIDRFAVDERGACAALADLAALFDGREPEVIAEHVRQTCADVDDLFHVLAVDIAFDQRVLCHQISPPQRLTDSMRARLAISTAICFRNALLARQESRGLMSSSTAREKASIFSIVTG